MWRRKIACPAAMNQLPLPKSCNCLNTPCHSLFSISNLLCRVSKVKGDYTLDFSGCTSQISLAAGFVNDETKDFPRSTLAYCSDGVGIVVGSLMGTSPLTVFIESATGIREGGRTGLTACMTGFCFFVALFFAPLLGEQCWAPPPS